MERGDREKGRKKERDRKGEGLCLISDPGECLGRAKKEHGMFSNWPCSVEREGRKKSEKERRQTQEGGEEKEEE